MLTRFAEWIAAQPLSRKLTALGLVTVYVTQHPQAEFSHGICPACLKKVEQELEGDGA